MDTTVEKVINLEGTFRTYKRNKDLQALTNVICMKMLRHSSIIRRVSFHDNIGEYQHHLSSLMRVYRPLDFYLLWPDTVKFLESNGVKVKY